MQSTLYFKQRLMNGNLQHIKPDWVQQTYVMPDHVVSQANGRVSLYKRIKEMNNRYLKLILLKDKKTIREAYFVNKLVR